ncbi:pectinesterase [Musa troglodytarum]|uniref:pectinesterase n=1 Tax=Musa troglodytarum TaxID=320322 RepID=A0A9E7JYN4_9LILI|nr:pectinesterase [Musa troglodytarum]
MGAFPSMFFLVIYLFVSVHSSACELGSTEQHRRHEWYFKPTGKQTIVVGANGSGHFSSVQEAVDFVPANNTKRVIIQIHAGHYTEKVIVPATKPYVTFQGAGRDVTVIEWHDRASDRGPDGQQLRTYNTASVTIFASYFRARDISFKVSASFRDLTIAVPFIRIASPENDGRRLILGAHTFFRSAQLCFSFNQLSKEHLNESTTCLLISHSSPP